MELNNDTDKIITYRNLRKLIGWLGVLLPIVLLIGNYVINHINILNNSFFIDKSCYNIYNPTNSFKTSISDYYYSTVGELLTGTLCAVAMFMFCYHGHKKRKGEFGLSDNLLTNLIGIFAIGVAVFPTHSETCIQDNIRTYLSSTQIGNIHFILAALFFVSLAAMSIINFRRTDDINLFGKRDNHQIYLYCGVAILICIGLIFIYMKWIVGQSEWLDNLRPTFWLEALALISFGFAWLVKGRVDFYYIPRKIMNLAKSTKNPNNK
jgi:hypothetical protein